MWQDRVSNKTGRLLGGEDWRAVKAKAVYAAVKPQTKKQYDSTVDRIYQFAVEYNFGYITEEAFWKYIESQPESRDTNLVNKLRSALEFRFASRPEMMGNNPFWRDRSVEHYAFTGLKVTAAQKTIPKGAIDLKLFRELRTSVAFQKLEKRAMIAIQLLFFAALRRGELMAMTNKDYDKKSGILRLNQNKGARRATGGTESYYKLIVIPEARALLELVSEMEERPFSFAASPVITWERCIKAAAEELKWDGRQAWSLHSLRHGGIQLITDFVGPDEDAQWEATKVKVTTRRLYMKSNLARLLELESRTVRECIPDEEEECQPADTTAGCRMKKRASLKESRKRGRVEEVD
jgi:integrase